MGTRSNIGYEREDGKIVSAFCFYDGYASGVGKTLLYHYSVSKKKIKNLVDGGNMSGIGREPRKTDKIGRERRVFFSTSTALREFESGEFCLYYPGNHEADKPEVSESLGEWMDTRDSNIEYLYLWSDLRGGKWKWCVWERKDDYGGTSNYFGFDLQDRIRDEEAEWRARAEKALSTGHLDKLHADARAAVEEYMMSTGDY